MPLSDDDLAMFQADVRRYRTCGQVHVIIKPFSQFSPNGDIYAALDNIAVSNGFLPLGTCWREISRSLAAKLLRRILHRGLAYGTKMMTAYRAETLAARFLALTDSPNRHFTNGTFEQPRDAGWTPLTNATFDTGVLSVSSQRFALLWVEDED